MVKRNAIAQKPASRQSVLFLPCYRDHRMLGGVSKFAYENNWILDSLWCHTGVLPDRWEGDGILCMLQVPGGDRQLSHFVNQHPHVPTVDLSLNSPRFSLPRVLQDDRSIGRIGAEHLISRGCRELGFVMRSNNAFHKHRFEGFCDTAKSQGRKVTRIRVSRDDINANRNHSWLTKHIKKAEGTFGIMAPADFLAQWVVQACNAADLAIPDDVAVLGVDNCFEICELSEIGISSIDNNAYQHGYEGAKLLHELMEGKPAPKAPVIVPPGALHVRASTDILATKHPHVAAALGYIDESLTNPDLTPKQVAATVPMSERRLHDAFSRYVGRSIYQEILHRRIQYALATIQSSNDKLWVIAEASGFTSPEIMSRLFRKHLGHPPSYFRQN